MGQGGLLQSQWGASILVQAIVTASRLWRFSALPFRKEKEVIGTRPKGERSVMYREKLRSRFSKVGRKDQYEY